MMLAHFLWEQIEHDTRADESIFWDALQDLFEGLGEAFDRAWRGFDAGERRTLAAVARSGGRPTRREALQAAEVPRS